jgi:hypothetical protein
MTSLPAINKRSKNAWMTRDISLSCFNEDYVPAVKNCLRSWKLDYKALLLMDNCPAHPLSESLKSEDGNILVVSIFLPKNTTALIQPLDEGIIRAFEAYYRQALLTAVVSSELQVPQFLKTIRLKYIGLAWKNISYMTIKNCWSKCITATGDSSEHEEEFLGFTEEDAGEASGTLHDRLQVIDLRA